MTNDNTTTLDRFAPETTISVELVKRAIDDAHIASSSIEEVYGPILDKLEANAATTVDDVQNMLDEWLTLWQEVRRICDAYMKRNRIYFRLRPHAELSEILISFEERMVELYDDEDLDARAKMKQVHEICDLLYKELDQYYDWARNACKILKLDFEDNDAKSVRRAKRFWMPNIRAMEKMMQQG